MALALWAGWRRLQEGGRPPNPVGILALPKRRAVVVQEHVVRKVLRGYAKVKDGNLILIGTIPVPHSKYKPSPRERENRRHLVRQGATIFKKELVN
jgi:hypothetical protein